MEKDKLVVRVVLCVATATIAACNSQIPIGILDHLGGQSGTNGGGIGGAAGSMATDGAPVRVVQVAPGWYHACALLADGTVRCWGNNYGGQLGDGTTLSHGQPAPVVGLSNAASIEANYTDSCAQITDGSIRCWGSNNYGQLGNDSTAMSQPSLVVALAGLDVKQLSLGEYHSCALLRDGTVTCYGINESGQLGDGTTTDRVMQKVVAGLSGVTQVAAGDNFTCALLADATVSCWGTNSGSDICSGANVLHATPTAVGGVSGVVQVAAGGTHVCALLSDATVTCWGLNFKGELGTPSPMPGNCPDFQHGPTVIPALSNVVQIGAGDSHTCALLSDGTVSCWGWNMYGQLGDGTNTDRLAPAVIPNLGHVAHIALGYAQTCAILDDATLDCWGATDPYGNSVPATNTPTPVSF